MKSKAIKVVVIVTIILAVYFVYTDFQSRSTVEKKKVATEGNILYGDVNGDNKVSVVDATLIKKYLDNKKVLDDSALESADVDIDGFITNNDAELIQKYIAESISKLPFIYGDLDDNGQVTKEDVEMLQKYLADLTTLTSEQKEKADVDLNGKAEIFK